MSIHRAYIYILDPRLPISERIIIVEDRTKMRAFEPVRMFSSSFFFLNIYTSQVSNTNILSILSRVNRDVFQKYGTNCERWIHSLSVMRRCLEIHVLLHNSV